MAFDPTQTVEVPRASDGNVEQLRAFIPTPNRLAQYLERSEAEVRTQLESAEGRQTLVSQLLEHEEDLRKDHADFRPELLQRQLDDVHEALTAEGLYLQDIQSPEKKGLFRRAWETVKSFPKNHPVWTTLGVIVLVAGGAAGALYLSGALQMAQAGVAAEVIKDFIQGSDVVNRGIGEMPDFNPYHGVPPGN
jgi:hypothetical protein